MDPVRFSRLKLMAKSPAHYRAASVKETVAMDVGAAAHSLILGVGLPVLCYPARRQGKTWEDFERCNAGSIILNSREMTIAQGMAASVAANKDAMRALEGEREKTFTWTDSGILCRGTPDVRNDVLRFHSELKTGETSDPELFVSKVRRFCYHGQLAWYGDGSVLAGLPEPTTRYIVAVEATVPFVSTVFRIKPRTIDIGRRCCRLWFERLRACLDADQWPGYCQSVVDLDMPDDDQELDFSGLEEAA